MEGEVEAVRELERIKGLGRKAQDESRTDKVTHELVSTGNGNEATRLPPSNAAFAVTVPCGTVELPIPGS